MKKKSFALSWGRKMFFGLGWALTSLMALNYFQSMIIPQTSVGWVYFLTTFIGHYGLILSLVYFLMYVPVISLFPSYYVSRIWSTILILSINLFIFFDSYLFARYRFHLNSFLWNLLREKDALAAFGLSPVKLGAIGFVTAVIFFVFWIRGEKLWRSMQARFSNPVSNWYLGVIGICLITSQLMYMYGDAKGSRHVTRLSNIFPLHFALTGKDFLKSHGVEPDKTIVVNQGYKDFYYPASEINCPMKQPKNILLIVMDKWNVADYNETSSPNIFHFASHGLDFKNHFSGGLNKQDGYFSILYSLPPTYTQSVLNQSASPVFLDQLKKAKLDMTNFQFGAPSPLHVFQPAEKEISLDYIESHLADRDDLSVVNPFLMQVFIESGSMMDKDNNVKTIIDLFIKHQLIKDTIVVITGARADLMKTPMIVIWPGKAHNVVTDLTSHYDIIPTIMKEDWKCKNPTEDFSLGRNIFGKEKNDQHVAGNYAHLKIVDIKDQTVTDIDQYSGVEVRDLNTSSTENEKRNSESILNSLQKLTMFYRR